MFLSYNASAKSGDRSPWGSFWFEPVPFNGSFGSIGGDAAMQLTAVYASVRVLAESISTLPFILYKTRKDGGKKRITKHWLYKLFARRPNSFQNPMEFREMMQGHLALRGNAFARIYGNAQGEVTDLIPVHPDRVQIEPLSATGWRYRVTNPDGSTDLVSRGEMFHIKGLSSDGIIGYNPIQLARKAIATGLAAQDYGNRFFQNDAKPGGWIEYPGQFKDDDTRKKWREQWQQSQSGVNRNKTAVLEFGMKYHELTLSNDDAQFIETRKFSIVEIARIFRVPPHMIGDLEKATFSNIEQQSLEFVVHTLTPWLVRWEEAIRFNFIDDEDDLHVEFPVLSMLRGDSAARKDYYHSGILDGWMTRNEARISESLDPLPGLDEPLRPLNMVEESSAEQIEDGAAETPNSMKTIQQEPDARMFALASAAAERVARRETEMFFRAAKQDNWPEAIAAFYSKHAAFVSVALGVDSAAAASYCDSRRSQANKDMTVEPEVFAEIAHCQLERLAIKGTL